MDGMIADYSREPELGPQTAAELMKWVADSRDGAQDKFNDLLERQGSLLQKLEIAVVFVNFLREREGDLSMALERCVLLLSKAEERIAKLEASSTKLGDILIGEVKGNG